MRVIVLDTGIGNLRSVEKAIGAAATLASIGGVAVERTRDPDALKAADKIVFPGQGGFRDCMLALENGVGDALLERLRAGTPYLGICLGLQVLFESSAEAPENPGLGWFSGRVLRLSPEGGIKIPHVGWNQIELEPPAHRLLAASGGAGAWFYFVHSFAAVPSDVSIIAGVATHGTNRIAAAVARDNVFACQFHPEKSQENGLRLIAEFLR